MANLAVREMVLYKHGVGFFVRQGEVEGEKVSLTFRSDEINDVLKSLAAFDQAGGQVLGIHYQTPMDIQARLASSSINLSNVSSLRDLLRDLRGRDCEIVFEITAGSLETVKGRVIGMDEVYTQEEFIANVSLLTEQGIRVFRYDSLRNIRIFDEQSSHDLSYFLDTSMSEDDRRVVTIRLSEGQHDLAVYYVAPSPTWRVSYRLVAESDKDGSTGSALLQGWGLFDNRLEEDLENVRVTLVAGQPISFIYELYASRIPRRPTVQDASRIAPGPIEFAGGFRDESDIDYMQAYTQASASAEIPDWLDDQIDERRGDLRPQARVTAFESSPPPAPRLSKGSMTSHYDKPIESLNLSTRVFNKLRRTGMSSVGDVVDMLERGQDAMLAIRGMDDQALNEILQAVGGTVLHSETKDTGETFQYVVTAPVSVKRGESALVPIIGKDINYQRELLYNAAKLANHPVAALRFDNKTGLTLERGPVTVVEDGDYKGEAVIPFTKEDNQVYVPYAVELGIKVTERPKSQTVLSGLKLEDNALFEQIYYTNEVTYILENTTAKPQVVTIEANINGNYELFETDKPDVETANERRWKVEVKARSKAEFTRKERMMHYTRVQVRNLSFQQLANYMENKWLDRSLYEQLSEILETQHEISKARAKINLLNQETEKLYRQQEQLRANLGALQATGQEANLRNRLLKQLETSQDRLEAIQSEIAELNSNIELAEKRITELSVSLGK